MRHLEKLKQIFNCCGKSCNAESNGKAIDNLFTLTKNGEVGGGGGESIPSTGFALIHCDSESGRIIKDGKMSFNWESASKIMISIVYDGQNYSSGLNRSDMLYYATLNNFRFTVFESVFDNGSVFVDVTNGFDINKLTELKIYMD